MGPNGEVSGQEGTIGARGGARGGAGGTSGAGGAASGGKVSDIKTIYTEILPSLATSIEDLKKKAQDDTKNSDAYLSQAGVLKKQHDGLVSLAGDIQLSMMRSDPSTAAAKVTELRVKMGAAKRQYTIIRNAMDGKSATDLLAGADPGEKIPDDRNPWQRMVQYAINLPLAQQPLTPENAADKTLMAGVDKIATQLQTMRADMKKSGKFSSEEIDASVAEARARLHGELAGKKQPVSSRSAAELIKRDGDSAAREMVDKLVKAGFSANDPEVLAKVDESRKAAASTTAENLRVEQETEQNRQRIVKSAKELKKWKEEQLKKDAIEKAANPKKFAQDKWVREALWRLITDETPSGAAFLGGR
jgi:hypothetical protein